MRTPAGDGVGRRILALERTIGLSTDFSVSIGLNSMHDGNQVLIEAHNRYSNTNLTAVDTRANGQGTEREDGDAMSRRTPCHCWGELEAWEPSTHNDHLHLMGLTEQRII